MADSSKLPYLNSAVAPIKNVLLSHKNATSKDIVYNLSDSIENMKRDARPFTLQ